MRLILFLILFLILSLGAATHTTTVAQVHIRLQGKIVEAVTQRPVENVVVRIASEQQATDREGNFTFTLKPGTYRISTRHMAYDNSNTSLTIRHDTLISIPLTPISYILDESTVRADTSRKSIGGLLGGRMELDMQQLRALPEFIGANDPLKILQLLPGVQTAGEGNSGIFIRGGEPGHNQILWNDAPIYNASHLLGAFSIFNTGHIGRFTLYKSDMEADFGGRLSSLIDVQSPDRIPTRTTISGDLGIIASQLTLSVPVGRKSGLYLSGRTTYVGLVLKPFIRATSGGKGQDMPFGYEFRDGNFTFVTQPGDRDKIILNAYWGGDALQVGEADYELDGTIRWSNLATSLQWLHQFPGRTRTKNTLFFSRYYNRLNAEQSSLSISLPSSIHDLGYKNKTTFYIGDHAFKTGVEYTFHTVRPQAPGLEIDSDLRGNSHKQTYYTHAAAAFLTGKFRLTSHLTASVGFRYAANVHTGPYDAISYNPQGEQTDSVHYGAGRRVAAYGSPEPRLALIYTLPGESQVQLSYNRQRQFINLVSISGVGLPTDFWVPASRNIPPQTADNFSAGYFRSLLDNRYEFSIEGYFRRLQQQMEFKSALFDLFNQQYILEESINYGKGKTYGAEFMFKKNNGRLTGWISYTLGWSQRNFPAIDAGRTFPAKHDRRHDLSLTACYRLNDKWDFSSVFVYATGNAYTTPRGIYMTGGNVVKEYGPYNGSRMPAYNRLDISANYWFFKNKDRESGINLSVYNVYKCKNPIYIFIVAKPDKKGNNQIRVHKKWKRLYDIIPSISWTFRF